MWLNNSDSVTSVPVTVTVRTLYLLNSSYGDAATGELMQFASYMLDIFEAITCNSGLCLLLERHRKQISAH